MRILILSVLFLLVSCKPEYKTVNTVEVTFENGEKDTFQNPYIKSSRMRDRNGDYRKVEEKNVINVEIVKNND